MNILYNLVSVQPIHSAKFHGGGSYGEVVFFALVREILTMPTKERPKLFCVFDSKKQLNGKIAQTCKENGISLLDLNEISPRDIVLKFQIDTFYTPLYSLDSKWNVPVRRFVFTWHGVRALEMRYSFAGIAFASKIAQKFEALVRYRETWKRFFYKPKYELLVRKIINGEVQTMTVSEHSLASIRGFFPELSFRKIPVFYSPMEFLAPSGNLPQGIEPKRYFLLTSCARWEKNNLRAVMAFDSLLADQERIGENCSLKMVLTGVTRPGVYLKNLKHRDHFVLLDYVSAENLEKLHENAYAFIFPSLNEGFGYPPVQSMRYGVPVAASGTTSIPEICGDAAIYFDPYSVSEIKNRLIQFLDPRIHSEFSKRAQKRYIQIRARQESDLKKIVHYILFGTVES